MAVITNPKYRCKRRLVIVVEHGRARSVVDVPEGFDAAAAAEYMSLLKEQHKPLTEGTSVADHGKPKYYLFSLIGSAQREDLESV